MLVIPAPSYSLAQAAWIPRLTSWRDDDMTERLEDEPCEGWAAAMVGKLATCVPGRYSGLTSTHVLERRR